ncbi:MAG: hypothetical protein IRZ33_08720 [Alicyclobacillaceae bacterium]|nr:hypothetical protein [Alicyclobacillaceae bacterium]
MPEMAPASAQPAMAEPPAVITVKDLSYLKDAMSWLLLAAKKCRHYAQECSDPAVAQIIDQIGRLHQRHYQLLLKHCQHNNAQAMAAVPATQ